MKTKNRRLLLAGLLFVCTAFTVRGQMPDFGKSYINITKGINGGTVETSDVLEIRAAFVVRSGTYDSCSYTDIIPAGTTYIAGTLRVLTNEGKIYKQFTDAVNDDEGWRTATGIRINLGYNQVAAPATAFRRGRIAANQVPRFGGACIMIASYQIRVTAAIGNTISIGGGNATYKLTTSTLQTFTYPSNVVAVYQNFGICANAVGANALGTENNGSFGTGTVQNRGASANVPAGYTYATFSANMPNDYYYGIANNTSNSGNFSASNGWAIPDNSSPSHRVFSVWDIIGDHTGAANPALGNAPANGSAAQGYMLVINAAYRIDSAFQQTISGLCPNTYYEISCWMRNICSRCGSDSMGRSAGSAGYIPTAFKDSSGVAPNITFEVDGIDYYSTGNLLYSGQWVKKGFTIKTGPAQSSFTLKFFNNAPGGGGNDWALDDISVATCSPELTFTPSNNPTVCKGNVVDVGAIIHSYFDNYTWYKWQKSADNGGTWNDAGSAATGTPVFNGSEYEYSVAYPSFVTTMADSGLKFKVIVGSTSANLNNPSCATQSATSVVTLNVINCTPLATSFVAFNGRRSTTEHSLQWTTTAEENDIRYVVEGSADGINYVTLANLSGYNNKAAINTYQWKESGSGRNYYRIRMYNSKGNTTYSRTVQLNDTNMESITVQQNPFAQNLIVKFTLDRAAPLTLLLLDATGRMVARQNHTVAAGCTTTVVHTAQLPAGRYAVQVQKGETLWVKTVVKQ